MVLSITCLCYRAWVRATLVSATLKIIFRSADIKGVQRTIDKPNPRIGPDVRAVTPGHPFAELPFDGTRRFSPFLVGHADEDPPVTPAPRACAECERLLAHSRQLRDAHVEAGRLLSARAELISPAEYMALRMAAEEMRIDSAIARLEFERHRRCRCGAREHQRWRVKPN
jgi:hypothetical protein